MANQASISSHVAIAVAVGPASVEIDRVRDLIDSIVHHDTGPATIVLIDDASQPRHLDATLRVPNAFRVVSLHHPRHGKKIRFTRGKGICSSILLALQWTARNLETSFLLKLDTDSLVISSFRDRLARLFARDANLGMVGAYSETPNGTPRDWSPHVRTIKRLAREFDWREPLRSLKFGSDPASSHIAALVRSARSNDYQYGEHCMGGGYALSGELLRRMNAAGFLDDPSLWMSVDLPEDVMVGIHVRAAEMNFANSVREGDVFGVRYRGLPDTPENLLAKRYAVIHAVKNDERFDEETIRAFYRAQREGTRVT